jgi:tetratricopeptide (TPR) repeat protein
MAKAKPKAEHKKKAPNTNNHQSNHQINKDRYFYFTCLSIIILTGIIIYSNSLNCSFHFDDTISIENNSNIHNLSNLKALWAEYGPLRFIPYLSFALNYHFNKINVAGYHLVNIFIHILNSCLVFWLTLLILSTPNLKSYSITKHKKSIAFLTALLFVSHPLAAESVTYIVQRLASMVALFYFLSIALYMKARLDKSNIRSNYLLYAGSFISAVLAMLSKENAVTIPFAILLIELFFFQTKKLPINFKDYRVLLCTAGLIGLISFVLIEFSALIFKPLPPDIYNNYQTITSLNYLLTQFSVIVKYIQLLIIPINQNFDYDYPISNSFFEIRTLLCFLFLLSLLILALFLYNRNRILSFGIIWFFLTLSIESSIIPISDLIVEHRTYLPSFGFFLIISTGLYVFLWDKYKNLSIAIFSFIVVTNSYLTFQRNEVWKNEETLYSNAASNSPNKARIYVALGSSYFLEKQYDKALPVLNKAIALQPENYDAYYVRGNLFSNIKKYKESLEDFNKNIKLNPNSYRVYNNRGNIFKDEKEFDLAINDFDSALRINPNYTDAYINRGTVFSIEKKYVEAISDFLRAIEIDPESAVAYTSKAAAELNSGKKEYAYNDLKKAMELGFEPARSIYNQYFH